MDLGPGSSSNSVVDSTITENGTGVRISHGTWRLERIPSELPFISPGSAGNALRFDSPQEYVKIPDSPTLHSDRQLTVAGWFLVEGYDKEWQNIFWKGNTPECTSGCENREYGLWVNYQGYLHFASTPISQVGYSQLTISTESGVRDDRYVAPRCGCIERRCRRYADLSRWTTRRRGTLRRLRNP